MSLRRILGWERRSQVPSEATFSRAFAEFARGELPDKIHAALIERTLGGRIIGAIARDATEIEAREKPVQNKANDGKDDPPAPDNPPPPRSIRALVVAQDRLGHESSSEGATVLGRPAWPPGRLGNEGRISA